MARYISPADAARAREALLALAATDLLEVAGAPGLDARQIQVAREALCDLKPPRPAPAPKVNPKATPYQRLLTAAPVDRRVTREELIRLANCGPASLGIADEVLADLARGEKVQVRR